MKGITEEAKLKQKRGTGKGAKYKPWIKAREVPSKGTASTFPDYKHGREIQALSQGEVYYYYLLRWRDDVDDIREQFPLELSETVAIAKKLNFNHPKDDLTRMTTDLLVTKTDGSLEAYSVKTGPWELNERRTKEKLAIEKIYWTNRKIPFHIVYKVDVNKIAIQNIMDVVRCYYSCDIQTKQDVIRHKIANKELCVDLSKDYIDYNKLVLEFEEKGGVFDEYF